MGATASPLGGQRVAVKFMVCTTPRQLWQRAKEALLSKLVSHPNLIHTFGMDVSEVTEATYLEWNQLEVPEVAVPAPSGTGANASSAPQSGRNASSSQAAEGGSQQRQQSTSISGAEQARSHVEGPAASRPAADQAPARPSPTVASASQAAGGAPAPGSPARPQQSSGSPVPFRDVLYHLDATPGKFMAKVRACASAALRCTAR